MISYSDRRDFRPRIWKSPDIGLIYPRSCNYDPARVLMKRGFPVSESCLKLMAVWLKGKF